MPTGLDKAVAPLCLLSTEVSADVAAASSEIGAGPLWDGVCCCSSLFFLFLLLAALGIFARKTQTTIFIIFIF